MICLTLHWELITPYSSTLCFFWRVFYTANQEVPNLIVPGLMIKMNHAVFYFLSWFFFFLMPLWKGVQGWSPLNCVGRLWIRKALTGLHGIASDQGVTVHLNQTKLKLKLNIFNESYTNLEAVPSAVSHACNIPFKNLNGFFLVTTK